jgi:Flp pilus assembly pilin Flp
MLALLKTLWRDDAGFVHSAELMLIASIAILSMIVGLSEVSLAVNGELSDVANAFGAVNQTANDLENGEQSSIVGGAPQPEAN